MNTTYLYNEETKEELQFPSLKKAAEFLGVDYQRVWIAFKMGMKCHGYIVTPETHKKVEMEYDLPRQELDIPHYATIDGKRFVAVKCPDKTSCTKCDIYKLDPPRSMIQSPLCYIYNCGTHKIVDICSRYKCIWKRK